MQYLSIYPKVLREKIYFLKQANLPRHFFIFVLTFSKLNFLLTASIEIIRKRDTRNLLKQKYLAAIAELSMLMKE